MERNRFIDVLKGIFIIFVIILHFPFDTLERQKYMFPLCVALVVPFFMMISGYVSSCSFKKRGIESVEEAYSPICIVEKIIRYTVPYTIAFIAEWIVFRVFGLYTVGIRTYGIFAVAMDYLSGGKGQGSYYYPIMIQFIFIFPMIYFIIRKYNLKGLGYCFLANAAFEILKRAYGMNDTEYRLLVFRYLFIIAAGCYIAIGDIKKNRRMFVLCAICIMVGLTFVYLFSYTLYSPKVITYWSDTSFLVCLYVIPILGWLIRKFHWGFRPLEVVGKASFNIFLVQMIYYNFADYIYDMIPNRGLQLGFNIINCVLVGVVFYYIEQPLTKGILYMLNKYRKRNT